MKEHRLDLLNNSLSYFKEAVKHAETARDDVSQWKFAIVHLMQAMELAFKESLRRIHPILVFEDIDTQKNSVSIKHALQRLRDPKIGNLVISVKDYKGFLKAIDLRNELTHYEFNYNSKYAEARFAKVFTFLVIFYRQHLSLDTEDFIDHQAHLRLIELEKTRTELLARARKYIEDRNSSEIWQCLECLEDTFVAEEEQCCFCHRKDQVVSCPNCGCEYREEELIDLADLFEYDYEEGISTLLTNFGYDSEQGCPDCIHKIRADIEDQRSAQYYEDMEMDRRGG